MPFNTLKCKIMHLGRSNKEFQYSMGGQQLEIVSEEKDLGVQFTEDLKPSRQCKQAYSKASKVLGMIGRTFSYKTTINACKSGLDRIRSASIGFFTN